MMNNFCEYLLNKEGLILKGFELSLNHINLMSMFMKFIFLFLPHCRLKAFFKIFKYIF